jgi:hypothetical protein
MVPDWIGWLFATFAAYRGLSVAIWLARGSTRTFNLLRWTRNVTYRDELPTRYWAIVGYNALVATPILGVIAWAILTPQRLV